MRLKCQFARTSGLGVPVRGTKLARGIGSRLDASQKSYKIKCLRTFLWLKDRLDGKPMQTKHLKVDANGQIHESTFGEARKTLSIPLQV